MYNSYLSVNKNFKSSINLQYDLFNKLKIDQYIPTTDLCDVIKLYVKSALGKESKATFLAGPYGKGKSYLMLMITFLLSKREDRELFERVVNKIKKIDQELADLLVEIDQKKISLIPVIINNNSSDDLNQNFMIALNQALVDHELSDIVPNSVFSESLKVIANWEIEQEKGFDIFDICKKNIKMSIEELKEGLSSYDTNAYKQFNDLFVCISRGVPFNPLISSDIASTYADVANKVKQYGYNGLFVVFDEFGVFLEHQTAGFGSRLNKIQQFAEKCETSDFNSQLHLCCINHKDANLYLKNNDYKDEFSKISGRFKQIRFDRSLEENYEIICSALDKKDGYKKLVESSIKANQEFVNNLKNSGVYSSDKELDFVLKNGFPLNPLSLYVLIRTSEKIAQNERTLFTFISDNDENSLASYIKNNGEGMLNVDAVYDYFEDIIKDNAEYSSLYYKVEYARRVIHDKNVTSIYKVIAILKIINDEIKLPINTQIISLCLNIKLSELDVMVNSLLDSDYLRKNINDNTLDYSFNNDADITNLISDYIAKKMYTYDTSMLLNEFTKHKYYVSNHYNFENSMTRYMDSVYAEASKFKSLSNVLALRKNNDEFADGLVINLIDDIKIDPEEIFEKLSSKNLTNVVVTINKKEFTSDFIDNLKKVVAAQNILSNEKNLSTGAIEVLPVMIEELSREISKFINSAYSECDSYTISDKNERSLKDCIYSSLTNTYSKMIILNNEQINKNVISSVTAKARNNVIDEILKGQVTDLGKTSAEATIYRSFNDSIEKDCRIVDLIIKTIVANVDNKFQASSLVDVLIDKPYGMRRGIIPLFIAKAFSILSVQGDSSVDAIVLSQGDMELPVNAVNISKLVDNSSKYNIFYTKVNSAKLGMIEKLSTLFGSSNEILFNDKVKKLTNAIRLKVSNMPKIIYNSSSKENPLGLSDKAIEFKNIFMRYDLNSYDVLFNTLPKKIGVKSYQKVSSEVSKIIDEYEEKFENYANKTINKIIEAFSSTEDDLKNCFNVWCSQFEYIDKIIFENHEKKLFAEFDKLNNNIIDNLNNLSLAAIGISFDDWTLVKEEQFFKVLENMITTVTNFKLEENITVEVKSDDNYKLSKLGETLLSNLMEQIDEYGDAISNQEKAAILKKLLDNTIN